MPPQKFVIPFGVFLMSEQIDKEVDTWTFPL